MNVTPDKRKIFLDYESYLLAAMKVGLQDFGYLIKYRLFPKLIESSVIKMLCYKACEDTRL